MIGRVLQAASAAARVLALCIAWSGAAALLAFTLAGFAAPFGFVFELIDHGRIQLAFCALAGAGGAAMLRVPGAAVVSLVCAALNLAATLPGAPDAPALPRGQDPALTVVWANVHYNEAAADKVIALARAERADVLVLTEATTPMYYAAIYGLPDMDCYYSGSMRPLTTTAFARAPCGPAPSVDMAAGAMVGVTALGRPVLGVHPPRPSSPQELERRDSEINDVSALVPPGGALVGDFNAVPWSGALAPLRRNGLRRVRCGGPFASTWLSPWPVAGLPIDHAFVAEGVAARCRIGPPNGSDHRPLILQLAPAAAD